MHREIDAGWTAAERALLTRDIAGIAELAKHLGTSPGTVRSWRERHADFPAPIAELACGPIWLLVDVLRWRDQRQPGRPGPKPKSGDRVGHL